MRYLKRYNESISINEDYETLKDILQSELFDEMNIETISKPVHAFKEFGGLHDPRHKFWAYYIPGFGSTPSLNTCDSNTDGRIAYISIFNVLEDDKLRLEEILTKLKPLVRSMTGEELSWSSEVYNSAHFSAYDYIIKLGYESN
jgi:hypothetical protein